jgi:ABC-2 type transport system ATP-binding protein
MLAIEARDVVKTFRMGWRGQRRTEALRGVSLSVSRGMIFGLLGPNGAGKTTLLSTMATLLEPDQGTVKILGHDAGREAVLVRRRLNMASGNASFVWSMHVSEIVAFYGRLYGLAGAGLRRRVETILEFCELTPYQHMSYQELSTGLKQRLALAKALVNEPELLFLDEPTLGLDPDVAARIRRRVADLCRERGMTIVLTTHYMREAEELCDKIAFIKRGQILAQGTAGDLKRRIRIGDVIALRLDSAPPAALAGLPGILRYTESDGWVECTVDTGDKRLPEMLRLLHEEGAVIRALQMREPELEEVFVELAK